MLYIVFQGCSFCTWSVPFHGFYLSRLAGAPVHIEGIQIGMRNLGIFKAQGSG